MDGSGAAAILMQDVCMAPPTTRSDRRRRFLSVIGRPRPVGFVVCRLGLRRPPPWTRRHRDGAAAEQDDGRRPRYDRFRRRPQGADLGHGQYPAFGGPGWSSASPAAVGIRRGPGRTSRRLLDARNLPANWGYDDDALHGRPAADSRPSTDEPGLVVGQFDSWDRREGLSKMGLTSSSVTTALTRRGHAPGMSRCSRERSPLGSAARHDAADLELTGDTTASAWIPSMTSSASGWVDHAAGCMVARPRMEPRPDVLPHS